MSAFDDTADRLESAVDHQFGDAAVYRTQAGAVHEIRCIVDRFVEDRTAFEGGVTMRSDQIEIRKLYVCDPARGDRVKVTDPSSPHNGTVWILDGLISDDGHVTRHNAYVCAD